MDINIGDKVKVHSGNIPVRDGEILYIGDTFLTVKFKNYPESFQFFELKTGNVRIEVLK